MLLQSRAVAATVLPAAMATRRVALAFVAGVPPQSGTAVDAAAAATSNSVRYASHLARTRSPYPASYAHSSPSLALAFTSTARRTLVAFSTSSAAPIANAAAVADAAATAVGATPIVAEPVAAVATPPVIEAAAAVAPKLSRLERLRKWAEKNRLKFINFSIAGGVAYGVYTIYYFGFGLTDFYLEQREADAPYLAFFTGAACSLVAIAGYKVARRAFVLNAGRMYKEVLRTVFASEAVQAKLGADVRARTISRMTRFNKNHAFEIASSTPVASTSSSVAAISAAPVAPHFRYVSYLPASLRYRPSREGWGRYWQPRRLQLCFYIEGSQGSGLVTAEVEQFLRGEYDDINVCVVDLLAQGEQIVLKQHFEAQKRQQSLLSLREEKTGVSTERDLLSKVVAKN